MPYVEIDREGTISIREPQPAGVVEERRAADAAAGAAARQELKVHPRSRSRIRHQGSSADAIYGPAVRLARGVTEVSEGVAQVIRDGKARGLYRHVKVLEVAPDHTTARTLPTPHVLTSGAVQHGTARWAEMEAERMAAEAAAGSNVAPSTLDPEAPAPVHKCLTCLGAEDGSDTFPSAAALERHIEVNHPVDDEGTVSSPADEVPAPAAAIPAPAPAVPAPATAPHPASEEF